MVRSADEMDGADGTPPAKRQKIAKLPGGQYFPEADWINLHPVSVLYVKAFTNYTYEISAPNITSSATSRRPLEV
jgi:hypothetical protein